MLNTSASTVRQLGLTGDGHEVIEADNGIHRLCEQ